MNDSSGLQRSLTWMKAGLQAQGKHDQDAALILLLMLEWNVLSLIQKIDILQQISTPTETKELFHWKTKPANPSLIDLFINIHNFCIKYKNYWPFQMDTVSSLWMKSLSRSAIISAGPKVCILQFTTEHSYRIL